MANGNTQHQLDKVRKPRVHITYDVHTGRGMKMVELPFIVGVMGDYSGKPEKPLPAVKDRKFVFVDKENFDKVLAAMAPHLQYKVKDRLSGEEDREMNVELRFNSMADFDPQRVVDQVEPLRKLYETREKLVNLLGKMDGNDKLEDMLEKVLKDANLRDQLASSLGVEAGGKKEE